MVWQLPYSPPAGAGAGLRPTIKAELNYAPQNEGRHELGKGITQQ